MKDMKTKTIYTKDLSLGISALVFLLQLTVAITSCFIWAVNIQEFIGNSNLPNVLEWLQTWDGVGRKAQQTIITRPQLVSWIKRKVFLQLRRFLELCSIHYLSSVVFCFISQAFMVVIIRGKWFSGTKKLSFNCLLWVVLLVNSLKRALFFCVLNVFVSGLTCCVCLDLFLTFSLGNRIFGQIKNRKKTYLIRTPKLETCRNNEKEDADQVTGNFADKLKLPEELLFAEERYSLDENVGFLSLGPPDKKRKQDKLARGSWFLDNLHEKIEGPNGVVRDRESVIGNALIWPAKFHPNGGLSALHSRKKENGNTALKKNVSQAEFSDNEFATYSEDKKVDSIYKAKRTKSDRLQDEAKQDIARGSRTTSFTTCNVLHVILVCSLGLNMLWFVWLFKDSIRITLFKT